MPMPYTTYTSTFRPMETSTEEILPPVPAPAVASATTATVFPTWGMPPMYSQPAPLLSHQLDPHMAATATYMQMQAAPIMQPSPMGVDMSLGLPHPFPAHVTMADATVTRTLVPQAQTVSGPRTTVMLRNIPEGYTRKMLMDLLDTEGFAGKYDFLYLPFDFSTFTCLNHAFVNFVTPTDAEQVRAKLSGRKRWAATSENLCSVDWNDRQQGLAPLVERYRNSPVMHESVPEECKPVLLTGGRMLPFPAPTQHIKAPKIRKGGQAGAAALVVTKAY
mmetsp:Transcript_49674/g.91709  ORF Transcript_49674/g.91709 Transcript_49674/m.91709 type:complete len:276 (+) Transcript_49674:2-829(+)